MRTVGGQLARTFCYAFAPLLLAGAAGCRQHPVAGESPVYGEGRVVRGEAGPGGGQKSDQGSGTGPVRCTVSTGPNDHPPSLPEPTEHTDFTPYHDPHCFSFASGSSHLKKRNPGPVPMWIAPELRMRNTDPRRDATPGMGMVVAIIHNNDRRNTYHDTPWIPGKDLLPGHDALIWLSQDTQRSVLFTYDNLNQVMVLATGTWDPMDVDPAQANPNHAKALWNHPPRIVEIKQPGTGWVTCLDGCCTPVRLFSIQ